MKFYFDGWKEQIKIEKWKVNSKKVYSYNQIKELEVFKEDDKVKKLQYKNKEDIFYLVVNDDPSKILLFIIKDGKIISFFTNFQIGKSSIIPYMLNEKPTLFI